MTPKLTLLQRQYLGSFESMTLPSSSTSTSTTALPALSFWFLLPAMAPAAPVLVRALFFFGAAFRLPTALLPPLTVRLMMPGAGRLERLLLGRTWGSCFSGAGVFRAVLARRGRSAARDGWGSWLVALPRDAGRRVVDPAVDMADATAAADPASSTRSVFGVAGAGLALRDFGLAA